MRRTPAGIDRSAYRVLLCAIGVGVVLFARANIRADSVDYYANLQRLSPLRDEPIVRNSHFARQRSPGYPVAAVVPHLLLCYVVSPLVRTTPGVPPADGPPVPPGLIPPEPLLLNQLPFHDYPVPREGSVFRWRVALALAVTSYAFLFCGLAAIASALRRAYPDLPGYSLLAVLLAASPVFLENIFATPLYATLTAFGASALFGRGVLRATDSGRAADGFLAGAWLGMLVLTRLETAVFAAALGGLLLVRRQGLLCARMAAGASWAAMAWAGYNLRVFGTPFSFEILRGDINVIRLDAGYVLGCLLHPASGLLFWSLPVCAGLAGLLAARSAALRSLGIAAVPLVALWVVRMPVMLLPAGGAALRIGGLGAMPPLNPHELIRSDINRYATVLAPWAVLGLRDLAERVVRRRKRLS